MTDQTHVALDPAGKEPVVVLVVDEAWLLYGSDEVEWTRPTYSEALAMVKSAIAAHQERAQD